MANEQGGRKDKVLIITLGVAVFMLLAVVPGGCSPGRETSSPSEEAGRGPAGGAEPAEKPVFNVEAHLLHPDDLTYLGAFRLPDCGERLSTFAYGGEAMTFNPGGDPSGPPDGFPGSLFVMGHNRVPYGESPFPLK